MHLPHLHEVTKTVEVRRIPHGSTSEWCTNFIKGKNNFKP